MTRASLKYELLWGSGGMPPHLIFTYSKVDSKVIFESNLYS